MVEEESKQLPVCNIDLLHERQRASSGSYSIDKRGLFYAIWPTSRTIPAEFQNRKRKMAKRVPCDRTESSGVTPRILWKSFNTGDRTTDRFKRDVPDDDLRRAF